jgi:hypothetical protein
LWFAVGFRRATEREYGAREQEEAEYCGGGGDCGGDGGVFCVVLYMAIKSATLAPWRNNCSRHASACAWRNWRVDGVDEEEEDQDDQEDE